MPLYLGLGRELAVGVRDLAKERFGLMAKTVLNQWGVVETSNIGDSFSYTLRYFLSEKTVALYRNLGFDTAPGWSPPGRTPENRG